MVENRHHVVEMTNSSRETQKGVKKNCADSCQFLRTKLLVTKGLLVVLYVDNGLSAPNDSQLKKE